MGRGGARRALSDVVVLGIGNPFRRDDGVGIEVARRVRAVLDGSDAAEVRTDLADVTDFLDAWSGGKAVVAIDALRSTSTNAEADHSDFGRIHRLHPLEEPLPVQLVPSSSHAFGLREALDLGDALRDLPSDLVLIGIEGRDFGHGEGLSPDVAPSVDEAVRVALEAVASMRIDKQS